MPTAFLGWGHRAGVPPGSLATPVWGSPGRDVPPLMGGRRVDWRGCQSTTPPMSAACDRRRSRDAQGGGVPLVGPRSLLRATRPFCGLPAVPLRLRGRCVTRAGVVHHTEASCIGAGRAERASSRRSRRTEGREWGDGRSGENMGEAECRRLACRRYGTHRPVQTPAGRCVGRRSGNSAGAVKGHAATGVGVGWGARFLTTGGVKWVGRRACG